MTSVNHPPLFFPASFRDESANYARSQLDKGHFKPFYLSTNFLFKPLVGIKNHPKGPFLFHLLGVLNQRRV